MLLHRQQLSRHGFAADRGKRDEIKDSYKVVEHYGMFGVFHGHGDFGAFAADFAAVNLPRLLETDPDLPYPGDAEKAIVRAFRGVEDEFSRRPRHETDTSGTSALVILFRDSEVVVANVGGSEAVLGRARVTPGGCVQDGVLETVQLSHSHLTYVRPDERDRVRQCGGRVENDYVHPMYSAGYGLVLTRSIGDEVLKPWGVVAEPEVWKHEWKAEDRFIILATRELWKYVFATDAVDLVRRRRDPKDAADALVREARSLGAPGNITVLVLEPFTLHQQNNRSNESRELPTAREYHTFTAREYNKT